MKQVISPASRPLRGTLRVPGDKSISHRAVLFAAMSEGRSVLSGVLDSDDVRSTIAAVETLGASVKLASAGSDLEVTVEGWGGAGPRSPDSPIDCGNSGTTARLLLGVLAGWPIGATLSGDASLSRRPMDRVIDPISAMGARFDSTEGHLPVTVHGGALSGIEFASPVASAQVKTALLLAGVRASGRTGVIEPAQSRSHTELLLPRFGVPVGVDEMRHAAWVDGPAAMRGADVTVPGDPSSAAFAACAAAIVGGSEVGIDGVCLNPTRTGFLRVLERMGVPCWIAVEEGGSAAEPSGRIVISAAEHLAATTVPAAEVPSLVDEIPVLAMVASRARGQTHFEGVGELRVKESDRLAAIVEALEAMGAAAWAEGDTLVVEGPCELGAATLDARGDHRLAMAYAIAGLVASGPVEIEGFEAVSVSYPGFLEGLAVLGA